MLQRYLGNKSTLTRDIVGIVQDLALPGERVCDAFSGSLAVSLALRRAGYIVSANDINILSWVYGVAFLKRDSLPTVRLEDLFGRATDGILATGLKIIQQAEPVAHAWERIGAIDAAAVWSGLIADIFSPYKRSDVPRNQRRTDFYDHYCAEGAKSAFLSSRGTSGRRRYLTGDNAAALDRAASRIRYWHRNGIIDEDVRCLLTAVTLDSVERVANIQGTYHDFPRDFYDPRALKPIAASLPLPSSFTLGPRSDQVGKSLDSLDFVKTVPPHAVLYLDPPYNFRQYTSYYFLPNLIAEYPEIDDLDAYFADIKYVRGQNLNSEFASTFCSAKTFLSSLADIVSSSQCRHVVLSYFNGKNHWNDFKSGTCSRGRGELERFFSSDLFVPGSLKVQPVKRLNYQSYGGHRALEVSEYLFIAEKAAITASSTIEDKRYAVV